MREGREEGGKGGRKGKEIERWKAKGVCVDGWVGGWAGGKDAARAYFMNM